MIPDAKGANGRMNISVTVIYLYRKKKQTKVIENGIEYNRNIWIQNRNSIIISAIILEFLKK